QRENNERSDGPVRLSPQPGARAEEIRSEDDSEQEARRKKSEGGGRGEPSTAAGRRRRRAWGRLTPGDRCDELVPATGDGFDEARTARRIAERGPQLGERGRKTVIEIDESVGGPQRLPHLLARDDFARPLEQQEQKPQRLLLEPDAKASLPHLSRGDV